MALDTNKITVGDTPTLLATGSSADGVSGSSVLPYNWDTADTVYLGGDDVAASGAKQGLPMAPQSYGPGYTLGDGELLYGICGSGLTAAVTAGTQGVA